MERERPNRAGVTMLCIGKIDMLNAKSNAPAIPKSKGNGISSPKSKIRELNEKISYKEKDLLIIMQQTAKRKTK